jgi:DNA-binding NtrC family response regulator
LDEKILIVDDQIKVCRSLSINLSGLGYSCESAHCSSEAVSKLKETHFDLVLLDLALGGESGLDLLQSIKHQHPNLPVVMMTGYGTLENAVQAIKCGALDFLSKPIKTEHLQHLLSQSSSKVSRKKSSEKKVSGRQASERIHLKENSPTQGSPKHHSKVSEHNLTKNEIDSVGTINASSHGMITSDKNVIEILKKGEKLAQSHLPILIHGESGTGKELFARHLHNHSSRSQEKLVQVNCASFTDTLLESELFGHEKGAFTGADHRHIGVFESAHGGTLHLDEIADMASGTQVKVLRALQEGEIKRVGATENIKIDIRVIASTHGNLKKAMDEGRFRQDLYYRLSAAVLTLPPLRDRKGDIQSLAEHFASLETPSPSIAPSALDLMKNHTWPGNVRELKNAIQFAAAVCTGQMIQLQDLPEDLQNNTQPSHSSNTEKKSHNTPTLSLQESEKDIIEQVYRESGYNKKKTAEKLGMTRSTLYKRLEKYEIG